MATPNEENDLPDTSEGKFPFALNQTAIIIITALIGVIILLLAGLTYVLSNRPPAATVAEELTIPEITEEAAVLPATATPTSTLTPVPSPTSTPAPTHTPTPSRTPSPTPTLTPTPIVVSWQELGYLTTVETTTSTVVEISRERFPNFPLIPLNTRILLMAVGLIEAGIDMSRAEVTQDGTSVQVVLPRAEITSVELLPDQTRIFDVGFLPPEGLEIEAMQQAHVQLRGWAENREASGILELSEKLGQAQLESLLRELGFEEIEITFQP